MFSLYSAVRFHLYMDVNLELKILKRLKLFMKIKFMYIDIKKFVCMFKIISD